MRTRPSYSSATVRISRAIARVSGHSSKAGIWWPAVPAPVMPQVPAAPRAVARGARLREPGVLVRAVVRNEVEDHAQPAAVRGGDQRVEVGEGPEERVDIRVVGDVVAEVRHRRGV